MTRENGIPKAYMGFTVDSYRPWSASGMEALKLCRTYVETFPLLPDDFGEWLLFVGPPGVGKTHLAVAVMNSMIGCGKARKWGFVDFAGFTLRVADSWKKGIPTAEWDHLRPLFELDLCLIDNL